MKWDKGIVKNLALVVSAISVSVFLVFALSNLATHHIKRSRHRDEKEIIYKGKRQDIITWTEWSVGPCDPPCGDGIAKHSRNCSTGRIQDCVNEGGEYYRLTPCNDGPCLPVWLEWIAHTTCSATCGVGVQYKYRHCSTGVNTDCDGSSITYNSCSNGHCLDEVTTTAMHTTNLPPVWSEWHLAHDCSATCGPGYYENIRTCSTGRNSDCHGQFWMVLGCNNGSCLVDGLWEKWSSWSACEVSCGGGHSSRTRHCIFPVPDRQGNDCEGSTDEIVECNTNKCPVDGMWDIWSAWSTCNATCDDGKRMRKRQCFFPPDLPVGKNCDGQSTELSPCRNELCPADGTWSAWSDWSDCMMTCGKSLTVRARMCYFDQEKPHGMDCEGEKLERSECNLPECVADGYWSNWVSWSQCTHTCGGGKQSRSRACLFETDLAQGDHCQGDHSEDRDCNAQLCPVDGTWNNWTPWSICTVSCGGGSKVRTRTCGYHGAANMPQGRPCDGEDHQEQTCQTEQCKVDARWSQWSSYGVCSATCGGGLKVKTRVCIYDPVAPMGLNCTGSTEFAEECNANRCPVNGQLTEWVTWSHCTKSCDGGTHVRTRHCQFPLNVPHGDDCIGNLNEERPCNEMHCPTMTTTTTTMSTVEGHWSNWLPWETCTQTCEGGEQLRYRHCTYPDHTLHGKYCPGKDKEMRVCNDQHCPVDGQWTNWSPFGRCSTSCGSGNHIRTRVCSFDPRYAHGENCTGPSTQRGVCDAGKCPVDGQWSHWSSWSHCPVTCGRSIQERMRECQFDKSAPQGLNCTGVSHENKTCNENLCPVDGVLSHWSEWTHCPVTCGNGTQYRNRTCDYKKDYPHGKNCPGLLNGTRSCGEHLCPVDGHWTDWTAWSICTKTCGIGQQVKSRHCEFDAVAPHGRNCEGDGIQESQKCNTNTCPVNGTWTPWEPWGKCSMTCGNGSRTRQRHCNFPDNMPRGADCSGLARESIDCHDKVCPVDGSWSHWSPWSSCTVSCGNGTTTRNRSCNFLVDIPHGAYCPGVNEEAHRCNTDLCPVDGQFGHWSMWTSCTKSCNNGTKHRDRQCEFDKVAPHGRNCTGAFSETYLCNTTLCPVNGHWSSWSNFTKCSTTCGGGKHYRKRICEYLPLGSPHALPCPGNDTDNETCNTQFCPVDGSWSAWSHWSICTKTCENGTETRNRTCHYSDTYPHGKPCIGGKNETQLCNIEQCPIDGIWTQWSEYTHCTKSCGVGTHTRNRTCNFLTTHHGAKCFGNDTQTAACNETPCPVDGHWAGWTEWDKCSATCGDGHQARHRLCNFTNGFPHGLNCTGLNVETQGCAHNHCPVDGTWSDWSTWIKCSATCGNGSQYRTRHCEFASLPHGHNCTGVAGDSRNCNLGLCPVDGVWASWSSWETCSVTCNGGLKSRHRNCTFKSEPHGTTCSGNVTDTQHCNNQSCPVDGIWSQWGAFSPCTLSCGNGTATRTRNCQYLPADSMHGKPCPGSLTDVIQCNTSECPQNAVWSAWSTWTGCSADCGGGNRTRTRECNWPSAVHGTFCIGNALDEDNCNLELCPVDGIWTAWTEWGLCSTTCGIGGAIKKRNCTFHPTAPHGAECPGPFISKKFCHLQDCRMDGIWSSWIPWGDCSATCGDGWSVRNRSCRFPTNNHGLNCTGNNTEHQPCNMLMCPVDGEWEAWNSWSQCSVTCGHGQRYHLRECTYNLTIPGQIKGENCSGFSNLTDTCTGPNCPVDGSWHMWSEWSECTAKCGLGHRTRSRQCYFQPSVPHGAFCSGSGNETDICNEAECPVDANLTNWSAWSNCNVTCGGGSRIRNRNCTFPTMVHGHNCTGDLFQIETCSTNECPAALATATAPPAPRTCYQCTGQPDVCEVLNAPKECPKDERFCINKLDNKGDTSKVVVKKCGTYEECKRSYDGFSSDEKCTNFDDSPSTLEFSCEYCCDKDNCNKKLNPPDQWSPPDK